MIEWDFESYNLAASEGWMIGWTSGFRRREIRSRYNSPLSDDQARALVAQRAEEGSELHQRALVVIAQDALLADDWVIGVDP